MNNRKWDIPNWVLTLALIADMLVWFFFRGNK